MKISKCFYFCLILLVLSLPIRGQIKEWVEVVPKIPAQTIGKDCKDLRLGKIIFFQQPDYPPEARAARAGGAVVVNIKLNEQGVVPEIETVTGSRILQGAATEAARKVKFSPTVCNGNPITVEVVMTYNFILYVSAESYFKAAKVEDFLDVKKDSQFYEAILDLTENYKLAFGYNDKNFYPDAVLTRGDLAQFLRLTLDLLSERAAASGKLPRDIGLFNSLNPQNLKNADNIKKLGKKEPYNESVKILLLKYDISLADEKKEFQGKTFVTQSELLDLWTKIFGADAVPVNFERENGGERIITRGEFALFLQESLNVLTYKVLP
ncbi:MAG: TonB family protein [Acidobacteriota bacterium]|nr:TonB family protein [Acidobacteriota bacterium]